MNDAIVRRIPDRSAPAAVNMAIDEHMLIRAAEHGEAAFRIYSWNIPSLTLGYFQPAADHEFTPELSGMAWVRRSTGGAAIVHDPACEFTYSMALPEVLLKRYEGSMICNVHYAVRDLLKPIPIQAQVVVCGEERKLGPVLCFLHQTAGDLLVHGGKVAGSAQRKWKGALLQHGSVLLRTSPLAPAIRGAEELSGMQFDIQQIVTLFVREVSATLGWRLDERELDGTEWAQIQAIAQEKYAHPAWNLKR